MLGTIRKAQHGMYIIPLAELPEGRTVIMAVKHFNTILEAPGLRQMPPTHWYLPTKENYWEVLPVLDVLPTIPLGAMEVTETLPAIMVECLIDNPFIKHLAQMWIMKKIIETQGSGS